MSDANPTQHDAAMVQIELTPHECDLLLRLLGYATSRCEERLGITGGIEKVAVTWLRDDVEALISRIKMVAP